MGKPLWHTLSALLLLSSLLLLQVEKRSLEELREYLGVDLSIHATVWSMQLRLNRKRFNSGQGAQRTTSLSQNARRSLFSVANGVSKVLTDRTRDVFHNYIVERIKVRKDAAASPQQRAQQTNSNSNHKSGDGGDAGASGGGSGGGAGGEGGSKIPKNVLPLPAELVAALGDRELSMRRRNAHPVEHEFGIIVEKVNHYVKLKKEMSSMAKKHARVRACVRASG